MWRVSQHSPHLSFLAGQKVTSRRRAYQAKGFEFYLECSAVEVHSEACRDLWGAGEAPLHSSQHMFCIACSQHSQCMPAPSVACAASPAALQPGERLA